MSPTRRVPTRALFGIAAGFLAAACSAAVATTPASAAAGLACPDPTSRPFAPWGDPTWYKLAPNGGFEAGATGWTLTGGAQVDRGASRSQ